MASKMSEAQRHELCKKLDADLDAFLEEAMKKPARVVPEDNRSVDEIVEELKRHPAFMTEYDPSKPMSPEMEALISLKYDTNDALDTAENYKTDGNRNFKLKKYRWAIDNYTAGIKALCSDRLMNAQLYTNRAASNFFIGNFRSAIRDCTVARKFKPDHLKAIVKGAQCYLELKYCKEAITWCDAGLLLDATDQKLLDFRAKAEKLKKVKDRDERRQAAADRKQKAEERKLVETIKAHGVKLEKSKLDEDVSDELADDLLLASLETHHPSGVKVSVDDTGVLHWPVYFLYPEHSDSDFIQQFPETDRLCDHIELMFGPDSDRPGWDKDGRYVPENITVYFEDKETEQLVSVDTTVTLGKILQHKRYIVRGGSPGFILLAKDSAFTSDFLGRYNR